MRVESNGNVSTWTVWTKDGEKVEGSGATTGQPKERRLAVLMGILLALLLGLRWLWVPACDLVVPKAWRSGG